VELVPGRAEKLQRGLQNQGQQLGGKAGWNLMFTLKNAIWRKQKKIFTKQEIWQTTGVLGKVEFKTEFWKARNKIHMGNKGPTLCRVGASQNPRSHLTVEGEGKIRNRNESS